MLSMFVTPGGSLNGVPISEKQQQHLTEILAFLTRSKGLKAVALAGAQIGRTRITQTVDGKSIEIETAAIENVLLRSDTEGQDFIQVNFTSGKKVLLTSSLIGFKPVPLKGIELSKLPKVVTTPDLVSVFEAIQDTLHSAEFEAQEITVLKRVFEAVLAGGEAIGFDLSKERQWTARIPAHLTNTAA